MRLRALSDNFAGQEHLTYVIPPIGRDNAHTAESETKTLEDGFLRFRAWLEDKGQWYEANQEGKHCFFTETCHVVTAYIPTVQLLLHSMLI